jgi:hypothetical protein
MTIRVDAAGLCASIVVAADGDSTTSGVPSVQCAL